MTTEPPQIAQLREWMERDLPVSGESADLKLMLMAGTLEPAVLWEPSGVRLCLSYVLFDRADNGEFYVVNIKEQSCYFLTPAHLADPRLPQMWSGWIRALQTALAAAATQTKPVGRYRSFLYETLMPFELTPGAVLDLVRPKTEEQFYRACLNSKRRLKKFLGPWT